MLYFVATPIGNMGDITYRAVETLKAADCIYCEDTRRSLTLLNRYGIKKPLFSYHKFNEKEVAEEIVKKLACGENIAVVSDAGMPCVSDPGRILVNALIAAGESYTVVPGASACTAALLLSGADGSRFTFLGFLPAKAGERKAFLEKYKTLDTALVFYSAPHDVKKDIQTLYSVLGERKAAAVKEITKVFERVEFFNLSEGLKTEPKGEYVLVVEKSECGENDELSPKELYDKYLSEGADKKEAIKRVAKERKIAKSDLYKLTIEK